MFLARDLRTSHYLGTKDNNLDSYQGILDKLQAFITRYYWRQIIKGTFLFLFFGGLVFLLIGALEYFLWLPPGARTVLLVFGTGVEVFFLGRYVADPLLRLFRLKKGLTPKEGSRLIGRHFPEVNDRLYNLLELAESREKTELLLASVEQRSRALQTVPFPQAVKMGEAWKYWRYAGIPLALIALIWISGKGLDFMRSYERVVNYRVAYEPPAPFRFEILNTSLKGREDQPFVLQVRTPGSMQPESVRVVIDGKRVILEDFGDHFEHTFVPPLSPVSFYFEGGGITSGEYLLEVTRVPLIDRFEMQVEYPEYLSLPGETIKGSGNLVVPEGSRITWRVGAVHADTLVYADTDTVLRRLATQSTSFQKRFWKGTTYAISASNADFQEFDKLEYQVEVIRDESPDITARMEQDSLSPNLFYFAGEVSDDHGIAGLKVFCYPEGKPEEAQMLDMGAPRTTLHRFYYTFPSGLQVDPETGYTVYFQVEDNDAQHGGKVSTSREFTLRLLSGESLRSRLLEEQERALEGLSDSRREQEQIRNGLDEFERTQREEGSLNYEDKQQLRDFLSRQEQQERLMEKFSREVSERMAPEENSPEDELLQERLERQEMEARKNAALMEELQKVLDQLEGEELQERLEEYSRAQNSRERSLEQLLELTRRYLVQEKSRQVQRELETLGEAQEKLSEQPVPEQNEGQEQGELNQGFKEVQERLEQLEEQNEALRKPMPWKRDPEKEQSIAKDQQEALTGIKEQKEGGDGKSQKPVQEKQKSAAGKMKQLAKQLGEGAAMGGAQSLQEDAEMLRQILDNLVIFSLEQEALFEGMRREGEPGLSHSGDVRKQQQLRDVFGHVDDSLFTLSLRRAELSELINTQITEVYYNIDKSLEAHGNGDWYKGLSYQQYVVTATNELAAFLADILDNMMESLMPGSGNGAGSDLQLPDIIKSQEELQKMMGEGQGKGSKPGENPGQGGQQGNSEGGAEGEGQGEGEGEGEGGGKGKGRGKDGQDPAGAGDKEGNGAGAQGFSEADYSRFYEIYKRQQQIRMELEKQLDDMIESDRKLAEQIAREMELFENELLRGGITDRTAERLNRIRQQLLKLENATLEQGKTEERQSRSNRQEFSAPIFEKPKGIERITPEDELLNREALPLRQKFKEKVREYFKQHDTLSLPDRF
jgi:hypothetical protein